jgi:hypothetical protein
LVVNTTLEPSGAPIHELDGAFVFNGRDDGVDILGDNISTVHQTASHVFAVTRVALGHHVGRFKDPVGNLGDRQTLVEGLLGRDDGSARGQHDARVEDQVGLELCNVNHEKERTH